MLLREHKISNRWSADAGTLLPLFAVPKGVQRSCSSQPGFGLTFCSRCGSTLCGTWKGKIHGITLGCLNEDPAIEIGYHIYTDSRASWDRLPDGVVSYPEGPVD